MDGIYQWVQYDVNPRSGELKLWIGGYRWFKLEVYTGLKFDIGLTGTVGPWRWHIFHLSAILFD